MGRLCIFELSSLCQKCELCGINNRSAHVSIHSDAKLTLGQILARLRHIHQPEHKVLAQALQMSYTTYLKIERDQRELSFLMALRICQFYKMDLHEFISMLSDEELSRSELSISKALEKRERKKAERLKAKVIDIKTEQAVHPSLL